MSQNKVSRQCQHHILQSNDVTASVVDDDYFVQLDHCQRIVD